MLKVRRAFKTINSNLKLLSKEKINSNSLN